MLTKEQVSELMGKSPKLSQQDYSQISSLDSDNIFVKSRQATLNIGTIGHVAHGKSTVVRSISTVNVI